MDRHFLDHIKRTNRTDEAARRRPNGYRGYQGSTPLSPDERMWLRAHGKHYTMREVETKLRRSKKCITKAATELNVNFKNL